MSFQISSINKWVEDQEVGEVKVVGCFILVYRDGDTLILNNDGREVLKVTLIPAPVVPPKPTWWQLLLEWLGY